MGFCICDMGGEPSSMSPHEVLSKKWFLETKRDNLVGQLLAIQVWGELSSIPSTHMKTQTQWLITSVLIGGGRWIIGTCWPSSLSLLERALGFSESLSLKKQNGHRSWGVILGLTSGLHMRTCTHTHTTHTYRHMGKGKSDSLVLSVSQYRELGLWDVLLTKSLLWKGWVTWSLNALSLQKKWRYYAS